MGEAAISPEAVEAAARSAFERSMRRAAEQEGLPLLDWDSPETEEATRDHFRNLVAGPVQAAYPSIRAAVLKEVQERLLGEEAVQAGADNAAYLSVQSPAYAQLAAQRVLEGALQSISEDSP